MKQLFKTLRYVNTEQGRSWRNKIGLRNPGLKAGMLKTNYDQVLSVAAIDIQDWGIIRKMISPDRCIELNVSCPNTEESMVKEGLKPFLNNKRNWCIIKLSPTETCYNINRFYEMGFRQFHASNTLPSKRGGISGEILKPYTISTIKYLKNNFPDAVIIAGGGIYDFKTLKEYERKGADHFSVSTIFFNPFKTAMFFSNIYF